MSNEAERPLTYEEALIACAVFADKWWNDGNSAIPWDTAIARAQVVLGQGAQCGGRNAPDRILAALARPSAVQDSDRAVLAERRAAEADAHVKSVNAGFNAQLDRAERAEKELAESERAANERQFLVDVLKAKVAELEKLNFDRAERAEKALNDKTIEK